MLVSHRKKFIYTKTEKTAGTSVEVYFERHCIHGHNYEFSHFRHDDYVTPSGIIGARAHKALISKDAVFRNHASAEFIKSKLTKEQWDNYFKFCVVRNPFSVYVSMFKYQIETNPVMKYYQNNDIKIAFNRWLGNNVINNEKHFMINGKVVMDYIIKTENLLNGVKNVCKKLNVAFEEDILPKLKVNPEKGNIQDYYNENSINEIKERHNFQLEYFNYSFYNAV